ncbi:MAG: putative isocitrate dehydrogenase, partial [Dehalococcoidia bacterium]|nr:putative isocitrate dehydrogenase [Dehalococcoidia bacterium]
MTRTITLIPGDGTGPEIVAATKKVLDALNLDVEYEVHDAGIPVIEKYGTPLPEHVLESIRRNKVCLKGPITTPIGGGIRSVNVALRHALNLYACLRPFKYYPGILSPFPNVDIVLIRENMEDLYAGIEFERGTPLALDFIKYVRDHEAGNIRE